VNIFDEARPHRADLFAIRRGNRINVLVRDGIGVCLVARRLKRVNTEDTSNCYAIAAFKMP
jgi:transposase